MIMDELDIFAGWSVVDILLTCFLGGLIGGLIGRKVMKKHFEKSGLV